MERRKFLGWVGVGVMASSLPVVIAACSNTEESAADDQPTDAQATDKSTPVAAESTVREDGFTSFGTTEELDEKVTILDKEAGVLVLRNPETKQISAVNPKCPHQGCVVKWDAEEKYLDCPCHGSKFDAAGGLLEGPATEDLAIYEVKEEDDLVLVKLS